MNKEVINNNEDVILELAAPATEFISGVQYDLLKKVPAIRDNLCTGCDLDEGGESRQTTIS